MTKRPPREAVARSIVYDMGLKRLLDSGRRQRGLDLSGLHDQLCLLIMETRDTYDEALEDWQTRHINPEGVERRLSDNWDPREPDPPDYGDQTGAGLENWEAHYRRFYERPGGNPGYNRGAGQGHSLPIPPLREVYPIVEAWWRVHVARPAWRPDLPRDWEPDGPRTLEKANPSGRLLLLISQDLDNRYTGQNCYGVHETIRALRRRLKKR